MIHCLRTSATDRCRSWPVFAGTRVSLRGRNLRRQAVIAGQRRQIDVFALPSCMAIHGSLTASGSGVITGHVPPSAVSLPGAPQRTATTAQQAAANQPHPGQHAVIFPQRITGSTGATCGTKLSSDKVRCHRAGRRSRRHCSATRSVAHLLRLPVFQRRGVLIEHHRHMRRFTAKPGC